MKDAAHRTHVSLSFVLGWLRNQSAASARMIDSDIVPQRVRTGASRGPGVGRTVTVPLGGIVTMALGGIVTVALGGIVTMGLGGIVIVALGAKVTVGLGCWPP